MLFNSYEFIFVFLPITFFIYFFLNHKRLTELSNAFLFAASLFFYSWWNVAYLPLILTSITFNYFIGNRIIEARREEGNGVSARATMIYGVVVNLGLLGYFKYTDFFISNVNLAFGAEFTMLKIVLPLAISFFTFQQIAYLVDNYRGHSKEYTFINYGLFVTFFPQLIAGPIVHHGEMMPQFAKLRNKLISFKNFATGLFIFGIGLFKKVFFADKYAEWVYFGFNGTEPLDFMSAWVASLAFAFQIYFDYSGYADMAIGLALMFNIVLPINFYSPLKSLSIQEFWSRWNMTLSRFLRDYVFHSLVGDRRGRFVFLSSMWLTFVIGGLWHGADWTFVFWGVLHGSALVIYYLWRSLGIKLHFVISWLITMCFLSISGVFFRAASWNEAARVIKGMFAFDKIILPTEIEFANPVGIKFGDFLAPINGDIWTAIWMVAGLIVILCFKNSIEMMRGFKPTFSNFIFLGVTLVIGLLYITKESEFLYFNF